MLHIKEKVKFQLNMQDYLLELYQKKVKKSSKLNARDERRT